MRVSGWIKLDEGLRDGAEVKKKKHKEGKEETYSICSLHCRCMMACKDKRDSVVFYRQIHF